MITNLNKLEPMNYYGFNHKDIPDEYKRLLPVMRRLETGKTIIFDSDITWQDLLWIDEHYNELSNGDVKLWYRLSKQTSNIHDKEGELHGLPRSMTREARFLKGLAHFKQHWWYYIITLLIALAMPFIIIFAGI